MQLSVIAISLAAVLGAALAFVCARRDGDSKGHRLVRFAALSMYRWGVAMRETVIVELVGAGGLGRLLAQQNAAFDRAGMLTTLAALAALAFIADVIGSRARMSLR